MIIQSLLFLFASAIFFTIPGSAILVKLKLKLNFWEIICFGTVVGLVIFTLLGYLGMRTQLFFVPLFICILSLVFYKKSPFKIQVPIFSRTRILLLSFVLLLGIIGQLLIITPSGSVQNNDVVFWSSHGHDSMWHLSLIEEIKRGGQLQNPVMAGEKLYNYHFFSDISLAFLNLYFGISALDLYFKYFPVLYSSFFGASIFILTYRVSYSYSAAIWSLFFAYFAGSFGFIVTWINQSTIGGESLFWASQVQSSSGNPPQIAAFIMLITALFFLFHFARLQSYGLSLIIVTICSVLITIKVYAFVLVIGALIVISLWELVKDKKIYFLGITFFSLLGGFLLYFPYSNSIGSFLIFEPWWFIRTMVVAPDRLDWLDLELRRQTYIAEHNWKRVLQLELTAFLIFLFGNLGMRFVGFWEILRPSKILVRSYFGMFFMSILTFSFLMPILFLQKGVAGNTAQFLQYFLLLFGILAGISIDSFVKKIKFSILKYAFITFVVLFSIPTQLGLIYQFYSHPPLAKISRSEIEALAFLKENSSDQDLIGIPSFDTTLNIDSGIPNIWDWSDSAYVSALGTRRVYLADIEQLSIMGYDYEDRLKNINALFKTTQVKDAKNILENSQINILYFPKLQRPKIDLTFVGMQKIYDTDFEVWKKL